MQDLRDKLLKAGLVDKTQARQAKTEKRRKKKKKKQRKKGGGQDPTLDDQRERYSQRIEEQAALARDRQQKLNEQKAQQEQVHRIRDLIKSGAEKKVQGNDRDFYFVGRDRRIRKLTTSHQVADLLDSGALAIVEREDDPARDYAVVSADAAGRIEALDAARILFWNKPGGGADDLPSHGAS